MRARDPRRAEAFFLRGRGVAAAWAGWLAGTLAALLHLNASYVLVGPVCASGDPTPLYVASGAALALAVLGGAIAWASWRRASAESRPDDAGVLPRAHFLSLTGLALCVLAATVVVAQSLPYFIVGPCQ